MSSLKTDIIANYVGKSWTAILNILLIPVYIKFLGIESYGLIGFFASLTAVIGILDLGIGNTMNRELAKRSVNPESNKTQRDLVRTLELIYWGIAVFSGFIILVGASFIANSWIKSETLEINTILSAVSLMGLSIAFRFPMSLYQGGLMGLQKQVLVNKINVSIGTLRGLGAILVLWLVSPTIVAFFIWQAIISLIETLTFYNYIWKNLPKSSIKPSFKIDIIKEIWEYAAAISANAVIGVMMSQIDKVILSNMLTLEMFGYYTIAATAASGIWIIIMPFSLTIFPRLVVLYENKEKVKTRLLFHQFSQLLSLILLPVCAILIVFSKQILMLWLHDPIIVENAYLIMILLVFGTMLNGMVSVPVLSASAFGWPQLMTYTNFVQSFFIIPLIFLLVNWLEGVGAAIAWIALNSTYILILTPLFFRRFLRKELKKWYIFDSIIPLLSAFTICIVCSYLAPKMTNNFSNIFLITGTGLLSLFMTAMTMSYTRAIIFDNLGNFIKKK